MGRSRWSAACLAVALFSPLLAAEDPGPDADRAALDALRDRIQAAVNAARLDLIEPHLAPGFTGVTVTGQEMDGFQGLRDYWTYIHDRLGGGTCQTTLNAADVQVFGDLALARGSSDDLVINGDGEQFRFTSLWTAVCRKVDGDWRLLRVQSSMDPVSNEFVRNWRNRQSMIVGTLCLATGLVAGWLMTRAVRRPREVP